jgi:cytosolic iron-sulfur protein assembly protein CIAO1
MSAKSTLERVAVLKGHSERVWCVSWCYDGSVLASCGADKSIRLWKATDKDSDKCSWTCTVRLEHLHALLHLRDGIFPMQATLDDDAHDRTLRSVAWSPDGRKIAASSFDAKVSIWEVVGGGWQCVAKLEGHENEVGCPFMYHVL